MSTNTSHVERMVEGLNEKFPADMHHTGYTFMKGRKYHRVVDHHTNGQRFVHCFVDNDGNVYKSAGWPAPAKGVRYSNVEVALENADRFGSYLYM